MCVEVLIGKKKHYSLNDIQVVFVCCDKIETDIFIAKIHNTHVYIG